MGATVLAFKIPEYEFEPEPVTAEECGLTEDEHDIIRRIYKGETTKDIAIGVHLSVEQTKTEIKRIRRKLDLGNRIAVASFAARNKWFPDIFHKSQDVAMFKPTIKQRLLMAGVSAGLSTAQIAIVNDISEETANSNLDAIYRQTGVHSRVLLARIAIEQGWVK